MTHRVKRWDCTDFNLWCIAQLFCRWSLHTLSSFVGEWHFSTHNVCSLLHDGTVV